MTPNQFCPECGFKALKLTDKFCRKCGHPMNSLSRPAPEPVEPEGVIAEEEEIPETQPAKQAISKKATLPERKVIILSKKGKKAQATIEDDDDDPDLDENPLEVEIDGLEVDIRGSYQVKGEDLRNLVRQGEGPPQPLNRKGTKVSAKKVEADLMREAGLRKPGESTEVGG